MGSVSKTLHILRHARYDSSGGGDNKDKPLLPAGVEDMKVLAGMMKERQVSFSRVLCSPAQRTQQTWQVLEDSGFAGFSVSCPDALYNASAGTLYDLVRGENNSHRSVLIVAHNPGVPSFVSFLTGEVLTNYKPGTLSVVECSCESWQRLLPDENKLVDVLVPTTMGT